MSILSQEIHSSDTKIQMADEKLRDALLQAAEAKRQVDSQRQVEAAAASLESLQKEAARRIGLAQAENILAEVKEHTAAELAEIKSRAAEWHLKVKQLEKLAGEIAEERSKLNSEIIHLAKPLNELAATVNYYHGGLTVDFANLWQAAGGIGFDLSTHNAPLEHFINPRKLSFYAGARHFMAYFWYR
jgi:chromosome segregation ATPase